MVKYNRIARTAAHLFASIFFLCHGAKVALPGTQHSENQAGSRATANALATAPILVDIIPDSVPAGQTFWVEVHVGTEQNPVDSLFGVSFELRYSNPAYIHTIKPDSLHLLPGSLLGSDVVFFAMTEEDSARGTISVGVTRKAGSGEVSGFGTVFRGKLLADADIPDGTEIQFSFARINGRDKDGNPVPLAPVENSTVVFQPENFSLSLTPTAQTVELGRPATYDLSLTPAGGFNRAVPLAIQPTVAGITATFEPADISPQQDARLTLFPDSTVTPGRYVFEIVAQVDTFLQTANCTLDVYSVPIFATSDETEYLSNSIIQIDVQIGAQSRSATKLRRVAFRLRYSQSQYLSAIVSDTLGPEAGAFAGGNADLTIRNSPGDGIVELVVEAAVAEGVSGFGTIVSIPFTSVLETPNDTEVIFAIDSVTAIDADGQPIYLFADDYAITLQEKISFALQVEPDTLTISAGEVAEYRLGLTGSQSYNGTAALSAQGAPAATMPVFSPSRIGSGQFATMALATDTTTANGIYPITIHGVDGTLSAQTTATLIVTPAPSFSIVVVPPQDPIYPGDSAFYRISIEETENLEAPVMLRLSEGQAYSWLRSRLQPAAIDAFSEATLTFEIAENAPFGTVDFQLLGRSGTTTRSARIELTIEEPPPPVRPIPFTPNNDGFNDVVLFDFDELKVQPGEILIFDLHGRKIIELRGATEWNGKDENGAVAQPGTYLYVVRVGDKILKKGVLALAR